MNSDDRSLINVLTRDHCRITDMIMRLPTTGDAGRCRQLADEIVSELVRHAVAEDLFLYPTVHTTVPAHVIDTAREADAHTRIEELLAELAYTDPAAHGFDALAVKLMCEVVAETLHEELDVFPLLAVYCNSQTLIELGDKVTAFKNTSVVEKTPEHGLAIRHGDQVILCWRMQQP